MQAYTALRSDFAWTDSKSFKLLEQVGVEGARVLDYGCGDGRYALRFLELGAKEVVGIDISPSMIEQAKQTLIKDTETKLSFIETDARILPFENSSFNVVFSNFVFVHFTETQGPFKEVSRVLAQGGHLLATFNTFEVSDKNLENTDIPLLLGSKETVLVENLIKFDVEIKDSLRKAGLEVVYYEDLKHPFLCIDPTYQDKQKIKKVKTIVCLARKSIVCSSE